MAPFEVELSSFLRILKLEKYRAKALVWSDEMGAAFLDEVWDQREPFADALKLKPLERLRLTGKKGVDALNEAKAKQASLIDVLGTFLRSLELEKYRAEAMAWCRKMDAASLSEVWEQREKFADALQLNSRERIRLLGKRGTDALKETKWKCESGDHEDDPERKRRKVEIVEKEEMHISLQPHDRFRPIGGLTVRADEKIESVGRFIEEHIGRRLLRLFYNKNGTRDEIHLDERGKNMSLSDFDLGSEEVIFYYTGGEYLENAQICVWGSEALGYNSYKTVVINAGSLACAVEDFKKMIQGRGGTLAKYQRLRYGSRELVDGKKLCDYGVVNLSTLHLDYAY